MLLLNVNFSRAVGPQLDRLTKYQQEGLICMEIFSLSSLKGKGLQR